MQKWETTTSHLLTDQIKPAESHDNIAIASGSSSWESGAALAKAANSHNQHRFQRGHNLVSELSIPLPSFKGKVC